MSDVEVLQSSDAQMLQIKDQKKYQMISNAPRNTQKKSMSIDIVLGENPFKLLFGHQSNITTKSKSCLDRKLITN